MLDSKNPYTLFLIFILLVLSSDKEVDAKLAFLRDFTDQTARSVGILREGIETMQASLQKAQAMFTQNPGSS